MRGRPEDDASDRSHGARQVHRGVASMKIIPRSAYYWLPMISVAVALILALSLESYSGGGDILSRIFMPLMLALCAYMLSEGYVSSEDWYQKNLKSDIKVSPVAIYAVRIVAFRALVSLCVSAERWRLDLLR